MDNKLTLAQQENQKGVICGTQGQYKKSIKHFKKAAKLDPKLPETYYFLGLAHQNLGKGKLAIKYYKKAIRLKPDFAMAHNNIGLIYLNRNELKKAKYHFEKALEANPNHVQSLNNLGNVYKLQNNNNEALIYYEKAVLVDPNIPQTYNNIGTIYHSQGDIEKSVKYFQKAIKVAPEHPESYYHLAIAQKDQGDFEKAIKLLEKSIEFNPKNFENYAVLGNVYLKKGDYQKAKEYFEKAISINPNSAILYNDLGNLYKQDNQVARAIKCYEKAINLSPHLLAEPYHNLGVTLTSIEQYDLAIKMLENSIQINPKYPEAYYHLGAVLTDIGKMDEAEANLKKALYYNPDFRDTYNIYVSVLSKICNWDEYKKVSSKLDRLTIKELKEGKKTSESPHLNVVRCDNPKTNFEVAKSWSKEIENVGNYSDLSFTYKKRKSKKIRVGYLSCDYTDHATAHLIMGLFREHDRNKFEIYTYSYGVNDASRYRKEIEEKSDMFLDVFKYGSVDSAKKIHSDKVDILVDLKGHTKNHRMEICSLKPAPVQVTYLGFPGTSGASFFDYAIVDKIVVPKSQEKYYTEKLIYMPGCYQINDDKQSISKTKYKKSDFGIPKNSFIYSCFNHNYKIDINTFKAWVNILKKTKGSVLWLYESNPFSKRNILKKAKSLGLNPKRIIFSTKLPKQEHLARLALSDVCLDTFICNGHTTTTDALWTGVPVVCLQGKHFASRVASSILINDGLGELAVNTKKEYENLAIKFYKDKNLLEKTKAKVEKNKEDKLLFNTKEFVSDLEKAYIKIWDIYAKGKKPQTINV